MKIRNVLIPLLLAAGATALLAFTSLGLFASSFVDTIVFGGPTAEDVEMAKELQKQLRSSASISVASQLEPLASPIFVSPARSNILTAPIVVKVFYVQAPSEQDMIAHLARDFQKTRHVRPIRLQFYDRENLIPLGQDSYARGPESLLREIRIK